MERLPCVVQKLDRRQGARLVSIVVARRSTVDDGRDDSGVQYHEKKAAIDVPNDDEDVASNTTRSTRHLFGADCPKAEILLLSHLIVLYRIIVFSSYSLVSGHNDFDLWMALLRSSLGYLLPNPSVKRNDG